MEDYGIALYIGWRLGELTSAHEHFVLWRIFSIVTGVQMGGGVCCEETYLPDLKKNDIHSTTLIIYYCDQTCVYDICAQFSISRTIHVQY